ncbi:PREDICTED: extra-large guanine nucleotide-binding protein 1 isoform X2 [Tarenaya hassleriana]|uniref:extra-large guanine nucleotide-binding protein 1 isoform X1 n=1 Tax=Tarenaya hassleriana TaxID=28532 RepID=UPI00053C52AE|nr:PREDICTED: extra-large guanine nucleotide-binding protein 1 isoform X1 [Tarenaya hassleriana]XP_019057387.1 PREDICTED: extra-large guanine nucleotide-binding protein 1 isoform X2 [Tarenaya hassleriana]
MPSDKKPDLVMDDHGVVQCSFAVEYDGPPLPYDLPRAVPINVERIPVAAVVSPVCLADNLSFPVVQPIVSGDPLSKKFPRERIPSSVSPTSVIGNCGSNDMELVSESTVSPTSVIAFEERTEEGANCGLSGELSCSNYGSGELSELVNRSRQLGSCSINHEQSNTLEFSDSFDKSRNSSVRLRLPHGREESLDLNDSNPLPDWESNESVLSMDYPSSRVSSMKTGDCLNEANGDGRRQPVVTFRDIASDDAFVVEDSIQEQTRAMPVKKQPQTKGKKGSCYRCFKGSRFTEKEVCLVCDAKYCSNCVLRAMGSMPEGRKCVTCIGCPIDEPKRGSLGKCSRMLKRLLNDLEVKQIMKAEKFCEANQLPAEYVYVNGQPLHHEELVALQTCPNPPKKLKPGSYWYDKVSGLWGKEGEKPSQIISPHLNVGGPISPDASNGNTQVFINGREITKVELRMLQLAGVQCAGNPHFWVNEDGSYQEEGQKNTKGYIWGKAGTKLLCAVLSLPVPSKSATNPSGEQLYSMNSRSIPDYLEHRTLQKILLVGYKGSGTSTIFKQAKILYKDIPFSEDERENIKVTIQTNVYGYLGVLLEGRERFEDEALIDMRVEQSAHGNGPADEGDDAKSNIKTLYSIGPRLKAFSDWLLKTMVSGKLEAIFPAATREYAPVIEELWRDTAVQSTYKRRSELGLLPSVASYFLERAIDILKMDYEPSDLDILYAEGVTSSSGLACVDFSFPQSVSEENLDPSDQHDALLRYQLIRVPSRGLGENCKWIEMFEDVGMVVFVVALSDYDQFSEDGSNKMIQSRKLFESVITHPVFEHMDFLLILNKFDQLEEKIERVPLTRCEWFQEFQPVVSRHRANGGSSSSSPSLGQVAFHYIAVKFKRFYASVTGKKLYVTMNKGLDPNSVDMSLKFAKEILKWGEERTNNICLSDYSMYSTEASSFSH